MAYEQPGPGKDLFLLFGVDLFVDENLPDNLFNELKKKDELNILVIPGGSLNFFPLELLLFQYDSDTTEYHFLGDIANITYAPSLSSYVQFQQKKKESKVPRKPEKTN